MEDIVNSKPNYQTIAKALIQASEKHSSGTLFTMSDINVLAKQLEEIFVIRWGPTKRANLDRVVEYVKGLK